MTRANICSLAPYGETLASMTEAILKQLFMSALPSEFGNEHINNNATSNSEPCLPVNSFICVHKLGQPDGYFENITCAGERMKYGRRSGKVFTEPSSLCLTYQKQQERLQEVFLVHNINGFSQKKLNSKAKVNGIAQKKQPFLQSVMKAELWGDANTGAFTPASSEINIKKISAAKNILYVCSVVHRMKENRQKLERYDLSPVRENW